ncbi:hypothetical protein J7E79_26640 [Bacillus sp. ISL-40]|uniref:hypothetical protein n=1 Tax=Bacillus sp. ISL-40 TaxID=2819126 RepID=UPI001BE6CF82|nr:hypothetical protein [Bacillus sp. ISL-40]MBT2700900.1 hypothetical protein [Bacillus sp. ISL-40]
MTKNYKVFYIAKKPHSGGIGYEILSFVGTKEEFLNLITSIILSKYGCYKVKLVQDKKKHMCLFGFKRRGRKKEFRVFIKDAPNKELQPKKS